MGQGEKQLRLPSLLEPPKTVIEMDAWLQAYLGVTLPHVAVCPDHVSPLEALWLIYSETYEDVLVLGNRGGGKTLMLASYATLYAITHPEAEIAVIASEKGQAHVLLNYIRSMFLPRLNQLAPKVFNTASTQVSAERILFPNKSVIYLRAATLKGTNAPHPHKLIMDEVELLDDWQIVQEAFNMAMTDVRRGYKGQNILASSRKFRFGIVQRLLDHASNFNLKVLQWCVFEVMQPPPKCPDCEQCALIQRADGLRFNELCRGRGRWSSGYMPIEHVWGEFRRLDPQVFDAQWGRLIR